MNRAERRRQEREQRKNKPRGSQGNNPPLTPPSTRQTKPSSRRENNPCPNGHPEQFRDLALYGTPLHRCPRCGEVPQSGGFRASPELLPSTDAFGLPKTASRQWVVENSEKDEGLGVVPIPMEKRDGLATHAIYYPVCEHLDANGELEDFQHCIEDENAMWELEAFEG